MYIKNREELAGMLKELAKDAPAVVGVDTETTGLSPHTDLLRLIQMSWGKGKERKSYVVDCFKVSPSPLSAFFGNKKIAKVFFNAKFDVQFLRAAGITEVENIEDAMLAYYVLFNGEPGEMNLVAVVNNILNRGWVKEAKKKMQTSEWTSEFLTEEQIQYAARDAEILLDLFPPLVRFLKEERLYYVYKHIEMAALPAVADMEFNGVPVKTEIFDELASALDPEIIALDKEIKDTFTEVGTTVDNLNSSPQLCKALGFLGIETKSIAEDVLKDFDHPIIDKIIRLKNIVKMRQFVTKLPTHIEPSTGRIHCSFVQNGTKSGRFSSRSPNLQQVPRDGSIRKFIHASEETDIIVYDYGQIELVIAAELTQDETMISAYKAGKDIHKLTASMILNKSVDEITKSDRQLAKAVNFG